MTSANLGEHLGIDHEHYSAAKPSSRVCQVASSRARNQPAAADHSVEAIADAADRNARAQISGQLRQTVILEIGVAVFDRDAQALDVADAPDVLAKRSPVLHRTRTRAAAETQTGSTRPLLVTAHLFP